MPVRSYGRRYVNFSIDSDSICSEKEITDTISNAVQKLFGDFGLSIIQPKLIEFDSKKCKGVIRCNRKYLRDLRVALSLITKISENEAAIRITGTSGTLKSLKKDLM
jgi:ribonuclease P/MRP protein subunit POP5